MKAIDTNVLVRLLVADDAEQAERAASYLEAGDVWIGKTVVLETEWVLRAAYGLRPKVVSAALRRVIALAGAVVEDRGSIVRALDLHDAGLDFADALHLASSGDATEFGTFDRRLVRRVARARVRPPAVEP